MGATVSALGTSCWGKPGFPGANSSPEIRTPGVKFQPVSVPLPLSLHDLGGAAQAEQFRTYTVMDDLVLPEGYTYDLVASWGDPVGNSRFGYNNDYVSLVETRPGEGFLTVNFESSGSKTWLDTYPLVLGKALNLEGLIAAARPTNGALTLAQIEADTDRQTAATHLARELLIDQGIGIISVRREVDGRWVRTFSPADRRISGLSGLENDRYLTATGPATAIFRQADRLGYDDGLGDRIMGTMQNCAGGTTPWGTVLSAEENFQSEVIEFVWSDGSAIDPQQQPFYVTEQGAGSCGVIFGLAGNKYGWMVEVDPRNPEDYGTKHTWLGRYRHEALAVWALEGKPLAVYSGCDRRGGHLYKFVSQDIVQNPTDPANSKLFQTGMLYGAKFEPDGTGTWIALAPDTPVNPLRPSVVLGEQGVPNGTVLLPNPNRQAPSYAAIEDDRQAEVYQQSFATLGDLYVGNTPADQQGVILIDAHYAANAAGVSATARPEDTQLDPQTGTLYIAFTSGFPGNEGGPDRRIFKGPQGETPYDAGWIMKLQDLDNNPGSLSFRWEMFALGGSPDQGGAGFANPDNLEVDGQGNVWVITDMSSGALNQGQGTVGRYGNNSAWIIPTQGDRAGEAIPFALGPMECEICGIWMTADQKTLFLAPQHPGETHGMRASENRQITMTTTTGETFVQTRSVPLGSNWPGKGETDPPKPSVVAVRRLDGGTIV